MNKITISAPGRIDLSGGATDWCGFHTLGLAINLRAYAEIEILSDINKVEIEIGDLREAYSEPKYGTDLDLFKACIELTKLKGFKIKYHTEIPRGSGLGGSAPLTVATVFGLNELFQKNWSKYYMAELAQRAETLKLNMVNGCQDQYAAMFGGLIFMDFEGKKCQKGEYSKPVEQEPYAVVERLDQYLPDFHILVAIPQIERISSDQTNSSLSDRYLNGETKIVELIEQKAALTREAKKALVDHDISKLYHIINQNNQIMKEFNFLSKYNLAIEEVAKQNGALAVKTCGAGRAAMAIFAKDEGNKKALKQILKPHCNHLFEVNLDQGARIEK